MSNISKFVKVDKNVLIEYIYNDGNLISEPYNIIVNSKDRKQSYISANTSITNNNESNQLFKIDAVEEKWGKIDTGYYSFLQIKNYAAGAPQRHDTIKIHLPINWTFGENLGFLIRVYTYDSNNLEQIELSNFYFDMTDVSQNLLNFTSPPLLFQEKLWGKNIKLEIPSVSEISTQLTDNKPTENSLNKNLNKTGLSTSAPIFLDFQFINDIKTINGITTYKLSSPVTTSVTQTPEFERLGLKIENSKNGDFFEIYGVYNDTRAGFNKFINDSIPLGNRYYVQYNITLYEQNIRGKTITITTIDNFSDPIDFRPIIKYSTTTAIIDVEMRMIDSVDNSYIIRRASYGMLQDEVSKYSLNLMKINLKNAQKPKIYNIKNSINPDLVGVSNSMGMIPINNTKPKPKQTNTNINTNTNGYNNVTIQQVKVPFPVLIDRFNIMAKSDNATMNTKVFHGFGKIQILLYPFDNIIKFSIANGTPEEPKYFDLTGYSEIKLVIKNDNNTISFNTFIESEEIDLANGGITFKITESKFKEIKKIYNQGINVFYITGTNMSTTSVIYTGLFKIYDDVNNVIKMNEENKPRIILDPLIEKEKAIATKRK